MVIANIIYLLISPVNSTSTETAILKYLLTIKLRFNNNTFMSANQKATILFRQNYYTNAQVVVNQGGTSSGKTYAIQQVLFCLACSFEKLVITVAGQDIPNLKAGVIRDALFIFNNDDKLKEMVINYNKSDRVFAFKNGSKTSLLKP